MSRAKGEICRYFPYRSKREHDEARRMAGRAVRTAKMRGDLVPQPCEVCKRLRHVEAHHDDYERPLDVRWFCRYHHRQHEANLREARRRGDIGVQQEPMPVRVRAYYPHLMAHPETIKLVVQVTEAVVAAMKEAGVNERAISIRLGTSRQALNNNFAGGIRTLKALASIADAIGYDVHVSLQKRKALAVAS